MDCCELSMSCLRVASSASQESQGTTLKKSLIIHNMNQISMKSASPTAPRAVFPQALLIILALNGGFCPLSFCPQYKTSSCVK